MRNIKTFLSLNLILSTSLLVNSLFANESINLKNDSLITSQEAIKTSNTLLYSSDKIGDLGISAYFQPQFQWIESKGASSYGGGDFEERSNNRFKIRRGRLKMDFTHRNDAGDATTYFVLQFDGTEKGVNIRDFWGRIYDNKWHLFHLSVGMMTRPFGNEAIVSSSVRESPERGRLSQILMNNQRDLGINITLKSRNNTRWNWLQIDAGIYNGYNLSEGIEYDLYKDFIGRISANKMSLFKEKATLSIGSSMLLGFIDSPTDSIYKLQNNKMTLQDLSSLSGPLQRTYFGIDAQLVIPNQKGLTQFRAEYIRGMQIGTAQSSETPKNIFDKNNNTPYPLYLRSFDGAFFYYLQHLNSWQHQVIIKYDWHNPQRMISNIDISEEHGFSQADVSYNTLGLGYIYYLNKNLKLTLYYDRIWNEKTNLINGHRDFKDDLLTCRLQFSF